MSDLQLFRIAEAGVTSIVGGSVALERSLQDVFEKNLETLLGVRFLASELVTEGGRMDSIGIDENGSPVIIEYKRSTNENVINQGLFYLDWLMRHRKDFEWLVLDRFNMDEVKKIDWSEPRLVCVAGDFTRYDEHAVRQMNRNIDLVRYKKFGEDLLLLELLASTRSGPTYTAKSTATSPGEGGGQWVKGKYATVTERMAKASPELRELYEALRAHLIAQGDDVAEKTTEYYIAFRRMRNYVTIEFRYQLNKLLVYAKLNPDGKVVPGFTRDVTTIGHFGSGDLEISMSCLSDLERAKPLLDLAYAAG